MLVNLAEIPEQGVYAIIDLKGKRSYINYSMNIVGAIPRIWGECRLSGAALEFVVLSVTTDIETLKLHTEYWRDLYAEQGYSELLPRGRKTLQYEVRCMVDDDYDWVDIVLVSSRGDKKIIGKFRTMEDATQFVGMYYSGDNPYRFPVYAVNSRTREFITELGMNILDI